jgi:hypothetical protein
LGLSGGEAGPKMGLVGRVGLTVGVARVGEAGNGGDSVGEVVDEAG